MKIEDRLAAGAWFRTILYIAAYLASAWVGWQLVMSDAAIGKWCGLACLLGLPVLIGGYVVNAIRRDWITKDVDWSSNRFGGDVSGGRSALVSSEPLVLTERHDPPSKPKLDLEALPASKDHIWTYRADDNLFTWSDRVIVGLQADEQESKIARAVLHMFARAAYPQVGEDIRTFVKRAKVRINEEL